MTQLLGSSGAGLLCILHQDDARGMGEEYGKDVELDDFGPAIGDYRSLWWPAGSGLFGDQDIDVGLLEAKKRGWGFYDLTRGHTSRYGVVGVTRDQYGSPLGGVTVKLFRTSTDERVDSVVSDASGNYAVYSPYYPDAHYIVTYKAGAPDVFGTSPNTLIGR